MNRSFLLGLFLFAGGLPACCGSANTTGCIDEAKIDPGPCTREYRPVCGCDGNTYGNACEASRAGVTSWQEGSCGG